MECRVCKKDFCSFLGAMILAGLLSGGFAFFLHFRKIDHWPLDPTTFYIMALIFLLGAVAGLLFGNNSYKNCNIPPHQDSVRLFIP